MKIFIIKIVTKILFIILSMVFIISAEQSRKILLPGSVAPSFSLPSLSGERISLSVYCGETLSKPYVNKIRHIVIVSFWATYCKPCQKELPEIQSFIEENKKDNIIAFCISIDKDGASVVEPFVKERKYNLPILLDPYKKTSERYGVSSLPALFVIDTMGVIRYSSTGYNEKISLKDKLKKIVKAIKEGSIIDIKEDAEAVSVPLDTFSGVSQTKAAIPQITPHQKWKAIARVECGEPLDKVAASINVSSEELQLWYNELKKAAIAIWEKDTVKSKK
jgi:peroxiredoxin